MIYINVVNQRLCIASLADIYVSGSQQFVKFQFNLNKDWDGLSPFAQFRQEDKAYNQYLDDKNCVYLPAEIKEGTCTLMLYGSGHKTIATTNYLTLKVTKNNFVADASSTEISQSLYDQLLEKVSDEALQSKIDDAVKTELEIYLESGKLAALTIEDKSISISKIDDDFKSFIDNKLGTPQIVESLPTTGDPTILYLVPKEGTAPQGNIYDKYLWIDGAYEHIGDTATLMTVDNALSATSENPVQNKVIKSELDKKITEPTTNGLVRKLMSGVYNAVGIDTTMPDSPTDYNVPSTKLLKDYVVSNPLQLSDTDLQNSGLLAQSYQAAGSTPGTVGKRTCFIVKRDSSTLDDSITGITKVPSSYAVAQYVKSYIDNLNANGVSY